MNQIKVELLDSMGSDLTVVNCARVSMDKFHEVFEEESDTRLINYLAREKHWTPFGQPQIQLRVTAPIFVARQFFRSTVGTIRSEVSRRYIDSDPEFFFPDAWRSRPPKSIKQGSGDDLPEVDQKIFNGDYEEAINLCFGIYKNMLEIGVAPEQARMVLPQSMMTTWIETGSLAYWARFCHLRLDGHAQREIQDAAMKVSEIIGPLFPVSWKALSEYGV
jgi:thymidylate synthase (FAD)